MKKNMVEWTAEFKDGRERIHFFAENSQKKARAKLRKLLSKTRLANGTKVFRKHD